MVAKQGPLVVGVGAVTEVNASDGELRHDGSPLLADVGSPSVASAVPAGLLTAGLLPLRPELVPDDLVELAPIESGHVAALLRSELYSCGVQPRKTLCLPGCKPIVAIVLPPTVLPEGLWGGRNA